MNDMFFQRGDQLHIDTSLIFIVDGCSHFLPPFIVFHFYIRILFLVLYFRIDLYVL